MVNLEMMKQLLDRGIEPTLLNEVLRRELAEAAPKAPQVAVQVAVQVEPESGEHHDSVLAKLYRQWAAEHACIERARSRFEQLASVMNGNYSKAAEAIGVTPGKFRQFMRSASIPKQSTIGVMAWHLSVPVATLSAEMQQAEDKINELRQENGMRRITHINGRGASN